MEITKQPTSRGLELLVKGRLDAYWSDHLTKSLAEVIREGTDHVTLNLSEVVYLSSAGIRVLIQTHKQLKGLQGMLVVSNPSEHVTTVLKMAGLDTLLLVSSSPTEKASEVPVSRQLNRGHVNLEVFGVTPQASLSCRIVGNPEQLVDCRFNEADSQTQSFPDSTFAIGLGAIGEHFEECRGRFGEFLATAGAAAYLPTDGTNVPDYSVARGTLIPTLQVLYGLICSGEFAHLIRFEPAKEHHPVTLTELVNHCLEIEEAQTIGIVMVAESAGLLGAALKRSPAQGGEARDPFRHPEIREWLTFTPERTHTRGMTVIVGIATRTADGRLASILRPLGAGSSPLGHFHAATFSYHPLKRGTIDLHRTVRTLFDAERLQSILHLLNDHREINGTGESEFFRGACWVSPVTEIVKGYE
jgi:anti-anti-sigma factor